MVERSRLKVDLSRNQLVYRGKAVVLTPTCAEIASVLLANVGSVVTHEQLKTAMWGTINQPLTADVSWRVHIYWLRNALEQLKAPYEILTHQTRGYELVRTPQ